MATLDELLGSDPGEEPQATEIPDAPEASAPSDGGVSLDELLGSTPDTPEGPAPELFQTAEPEAPEEGGGFLESIGIKEIRPDANLTPAEEAEALQEPFIMADPSLWIEGMAMGPLALVKRVGVKAAVKGLTKVNPFSGTFWKSNPIGASIKMGAEFQTLGIPYGAIKLARLGLSGTRMAGHMISNPKNVAVEAENAYKAFLEGFKVDTAASGAAVGFMWEAINQLREEEFDPEGLIHWAALGTIISPTASGTMSAIKNRVRSAKEAGSLPEALKFFLSGRGMTERYMEILRVLKGDVTIGVRTSMDATRRIMDQLNAAEQYRLGQLIAGGVSTGLKGQKIVGGKMQEVDSPGLQKMADEVRVVLNQLRDELIAVGSLSPKTIDFSKKFFQEYMPRLMQAKVIGRPKSFIASTLGFAPKQISAGKAGQLSARGETVYVEMPQKPYVEGLDPESMRVATGRGVRKGMQEAETVTENIERRLPKIKPMPTTKVTVKGPVIRGEDFTVSRGPNETIHIPAIGNPENIRERTEVLGDMLSRGFKVVDRKGRHVTLWRDTPEVLRLTPVERGGLGEVREAGVPLAFGIAQGKREVAVKKFFSSIAKDEAWVRDGEAIGYSQITGSKKEWGDLAGKFVRDDVGAEVHSTIELMNSMDGVARKALKMWKYGKVVLNPSSQLRNLMSNVFLADMGGLSPFRPSGMRAYVMTAQEFAGTDILPKNFSFGMKGLANIAKGLSRRKNVGQYMKEMQSSESGNLMGSSFSQAELRNLGTEFFAAKETNMLHRMLDAGSNFAQKMGQKVRISPGEIYQATELFNKGTLFIHGRNTGMSIKDAANYARKYGIDYDEVSPLVEMLRKSPFGAPFMTFSAKALPLAFENLVKHPFRVAKWPIAALAATEYSRRSLNEEASEAGNLAELAKLNPVRWIRMPFNDDNGRPVHLDMGYILPWGDLMEMYDYANGGEGHIGLLPLVNSPGASLIQAMFNIDSFQKRPIHPHESAGELYPQNFESVTDRLGKFTRDMLPAFTPEIPGTDFGGGYSYQRMKKAIQGHKGQRGRIKQSVPSAIAQSFLGLNTRRTDPKDELYYRIREERDKIQNATLEIAKTASDRNMSREEKTEIFAKNKAIIAKAAGELSRYRKLATGSKRVSPGDAGMGDVARPIRQAREAMPQSVTDAMNAVRNRVAPPAPTSSTPTPQKQALTPAGGGVVPKGSRTDELLQYLKTR